MSATYACIFYIYCHNPTHNTETISIHTTKLIDYPLSEIGHSKIWILISFNNRIYNIILHFVRIHRDSEGKPFQRKKLRVKRQVTYWFLQLSQISTSKQTYLENLEDRANHLFA